MLVVTSSWTGKHRGSLSGGGLGEGLALISLSRRKGFEREGAVGSGTFPSSPADPRPVHTHFYPSSVSYFVCSILFFVRGRLFSHLV